MTKPDLSNDLAKRQWAWLCQRVGDRRAQAAIDAAVARGRRAYVLNAARELGLRMPGDSELPVIKTEQSDQVRKQHLSEMKAALGMREKPQPEP